MSWPARVLKPVSDLLAPVIGARAADAFHEFLVFGVKQALACAFAGSFLFLLVISGHLTIPGLARYDFLFLGAIAIQLALIGLRLETWREAAVLSLFHAIGMALELFKTSAEVARGAIPSRHFRIGTVPLYSGFMYAAVASYIMQAWRIQDLRMTKFPNLWLAVGLSAAIYANFFTNHYVADVRWFLAAAVLVTFRKTWVHFTVVTAERKMPLVLAFVLIRFFIWVAENVATFFGAWVYPQQEQQWAIVGLNKISSWMLLVIISVIIVAALKQVFPTRRAKP